MSDGTEIPLRRDPDVVLPVEDRSRIEAGEQYRLDVRRRLEASSRENEKKHVWREKLFIPAVIALLTLLASEWAIPRAADLIDRDRRQAEVAGTLMQDVAQQTAEIKASLQTRSDALDEFWLGSARINAMLGEFALKRDLGEMTVREFERQDTQIENDRKHVTERNDKSEDEHASASRTFRTWLIRARLKIESLYESTAHREAAVSALADLVWCV